MIDHPGEQIVERIWVELREAVLPPHGVENFFACNTKRVCQRPSGTRGVAEVDQGTVDTKRCRKGLLVIEPAVQVHAATVVGNGGVEEVVLAETDAEVGRCESELFGEFGLYCIMGAHGSCIGFLEESYRYVRIRDMCTGNYQQKRYRGRNSAEICTPLGSRVARGPLKLA